MGRWKPGMTPNEYASYKFDANAYHMVKKGPPPKMYTQAMDEFRGIYREVIAAKESLTGAAYETYITRQSVYYKNLLTEVENASAYFKPEALTKLNNAQSFTAKIIRETNVTKAINNVNAIQGKWLASYANIKDMRALALTAEGRKVLKAARSGFPHYKKLYYIWDRLGTKFWNILQLLDLTILVVANQEWMYLYMEENRQDLGLIVQAQITRESINSGNISSQPTNIVGQGEPTEDEIFDPTLEPWRKEDCALYTINSLMEFYIKDDDTVTGQKIWPLLSEFTNSAKENKFELYEAISTAQGYIWDLIWKLDELYEEFEFEAQEELDELSTLLSDALTYTDIVYQALIDDEWFYYDPEVY